MRGYMGLADIRELLGISSPTLHRRIKEFPILLKPIMYEGRSPRFSAIQIQIFLSHLEGQLTIEQANREWQDCIPSTHSPL